MAPDAKPEEKEEKEGGFLSHLVELRGCLLRIIVVLLVLVFAFFPFAGDLYSLLALPLMQELASGQLISIGVIDPFIIQITTAFFFALWLGLPYLLYEIWRFVAPGLYQEEKKLLLPVIISGTLLFSLGVLFSYFLVFKVVFAFIAGITPESVQWTPDVRAYFGFIIKVFIGFGLAFETPVVVYILLRMGFVELETMKRARPYVIVGAFVVAAIVTPPDVISQIMLAIPCWLLYELGMLLAPKKSRRKVSEEESASSPAE